MARSKTNNDEFRSPRTRRKVKRRHLVGLSLLVGLGFLVVLLPKILTSPSLVSGVIDRYAGIAPLKVEFDRIDAGWLAPVRASGIRLKDQDAKVVAQIAEVTTQKGLLGWITNSSDLGNIQVSGLEAAVVARDGTTNIESALAHLLEASPEETPDEESDSAPATVGTIEIVDAKLLLMESGRPEQWVVQIPKLTATLPTASQIIGPIEMQATIGEVSGAVADSVGTMAAKVQQAGDAFEVRAQLKHVPIDFWHVVHARLPEVPIDELQGRVSATLSGKIVDANSWSFDVQQLESQGLAITAPELVGADPARLAVVAATGRASLANSMMQVEGAQLACDFGSVNAAASLPWPMTLPTATNPFIEGAAINAEGSIDLPKLVQAANSLLPVRDDTELLSGTAQFLVSQTLGPAGTPASRAKLTLAGLKANAAGQQLSWNEPLAIELIADKNDAGLQFGANAQAEFCNVKGGGTIQSGQFQGDVNLDLLQQRLSQWIDLPISTMNGAADVSLVWNMTSSDVVEAQGNLNTTPLRIATTTGGEISEPAWTGVFSATARLAGGTPKQLDRAKLELTAQNEKLTIDLQEPLALAAAAEGETPTPPAAFAFTLAGDLAGWKRRGMVWLSEPPEMELGGNISLAVGGRVDLSHVEIHQANWRSKPIRVFTPSLNISEAEMLGNFKGRVDTSDLTRLQVEALQVRATSFSIGAKDEASADGNGRIGQAMFLVDLNQLMSSLDSPDAVLPPGGVASSTSEMSASGRVQGQLSWQVTSNAAGIALSATGENIAVSSQAPGTAVPQSLWNEPSVTTELSGKWTAATGAVDVSNLKIRTDWCDYQGTLAYTSQDEKQNVVSKGQAVVDTSKLSTKISPMTGNQVQMVGVQTVPVDVQWSSSTNATGSGATSMLAGLQAATRVGWQQARVVGINVGQADVPVTISNGNLASKAEIPVSGGMLRWDITSDLTADELVINQSPMTVLENVEITEEMCKGWLKYVTPIIAEATSVDGRLSLILNQAKLTPANTRRQTVAGQLVMHSAEVGPGPLSNQIIAMVKQIDAIRKKDFTQAVSSQKVWLKMPEQRIDFQMVDGRVIHRNLNVRVGDVTLSTSGSVDVSGQMDMLASMPVPDDWVDKSPFLAGLRGQSLQFPMRGTLTQPQMDGEALRQLGRQTVQGAAQGLLEKGLSRGFEKLFGAPPTQQPQPQ